MREGRNGSRTSAELGDGRHANLKNDEGFGPPYLF
jgi:hypothetical protein